MIHGEGSASQWPQLASLLRDAVADARLAAGRGPAGERRAARADEVLRAAGIGPGHPSLYPTERPNGELES